MILDQMAKVAIKDYICIHIYIYNCSINYNIYIYVYTSFWDEVEYSTKYDSLLYVLYITTNHPFQKAS